MSNSFLGELRLVGFNFAPINWATADGQLMPISRSTALFSLLGTNFGGDGKSTFALPNLQGNIPIGAGQGPGLSPYDVGQDGGAPTVTLAQNEMPQHTHTLRCDSTPASGTTPVNSAFARGGTGAGNLYTTSATPKVQMNTGIVTFYGGNLPHNNMMPYLTLNWIIALSGVFPARS
jgi:microcystin-dependent protein